MPPSNRTGGTMIRSGEPILAMDTAGREGSVAVGLFPDPPHPNPGSLPSAPGSRPPEGMEILARRTLGADEEHASLLIPRIAEVLAEIGAEPEDLAGIVVGAGPGSFTGVRVGAATAKGMARAGGLPLWAFSSLAAAAAVEGREPSRPRCVLFDARGDRVYLGAYRLASHSLETLVEPRAATVSEVLEGLIPPGALVLGDGAYRHRALIEGGGHTVLPPPAGRPAADGLLRLLGLDANAQPLEDPSHWEPEYLRKSGAERMWKTRREPRR